MAGSRLVAGDAGRGRGIEPPVNNNPGAAAQPSSAQASTTTQSAAITSPTPPPPPPPPAYYYPAQASSSSPQVATPATLPYASGPVAAPIAPGSDLGPLRALAAELNEGRSNRGELSAESRVAIVTCIAVGMSTRAVADAFGVSPHTVRNAQERWRTRHSNASKPRSGRPKKLTAADERAIVEASRRGLPVGTRKTLGQAWGVSYVTVRRILKKHESSSASPSGAGKAAAGKASAARKGAAAAAAATTAATSSFPATATPTQ